MDRNHWLAFSAVKPTATVWRESKNPGQKGWNRQFIHTAPPSQATSPASPGTVHPDSTSPSPASSVDPESSPSTTPPAPSSSSWQAGVAEKNHVPFRTPASPQTRAWRILNAAGTGQKTGSRALAIRVLGLIPNNPRARKLAEAGLSDEKSEVRTAAAGALGDMKSKISIPLLRKALDDDDPSVALAAAHALDRMHDDSAYDVYYEILTGKRKSGKGLIASQAAMLKDPKKIAELGFEEGIGFIPFAGIGWEAFKIIHKDDSSPIRAAAAKVLANDPDPAATKALTDAVSDKSWVVRAAALEALAKRGDRSALNAVQASMTDDKEAVKFTAAAAVVRLTAVQEGKKQKNQ